MSAEAVQTPQFDARFPNMNQTKNCWQNYVDYQRCVKVKGEAFTPCQQFKRAFGSLCPIDWVRPGPTFAPVSLSPFFLTHRAVY